VWNKCLFFVTNIDMAVTTDVLVVFLSVLEANAGSLLQISAKGPDILAASVYLSLYGKIQA